ncbi:MAG: adenylyltransferase/cytidyltransferase family protein, partial [Limisphaerales bacterium]
MNAAQSHPKRVVVTGAFDDIRSRHFRFLEEAARFGELTVLVWPDGAVEGVTGKPPKFPLAERLYLLNAIRYVRRAAPLEGTTNADAPPFMPGSDADVWVDESSPSNAARLGVCRQRGLDYRVLSPELLKGFPQPPPQPGAPGRKKVVVTGCYDWFHSGHVRFFEEVSAYGDLYVIVGHAANIRLLKGQGHPFLPQEERRYLAGSVRYVT